MRHRSYIGSLTALFLIIVISGLGGAACGGGERNTNANLAVSPSPTPDPCASVTDQMIVDMIYGQLIKDPDILPQIKQINVTAKAGVVTLWGWVSDKTRYDKVLYIAGNTSCVKKPVIADNFYDHTGNPTQPSPGCVPPLVRCGDICVPDHCFWSADTAATGETNTKSSTNTMPGTNTKPGANSTNNSNTKAN